MAADLRLRPAQENILRYEEGRLGISAVPGSGKTFILSRLAAKLVQKVASAGPLDDREVLVVTFTNAAVENFRSRIGQFIQSQNLLPTGFRVRTLHSLAHDIVRERPALVGLGEEFDIVDDRSKQEIMRQAVSNFLQANPDVLGGLIQPERLTNRRLMEHKLPEDAQDIAEAVIRRVKDLRTDAETLERSLRQQSGSWPLLSFGLQMCRDYGRVMSVRGAVDFDDLISLALQALEADSDFLARLQRRWPYILEDEAQDSSALQERMLRLLTSAHGNWVRVGDPNQSINATFTSADPKFLRNFVGREGVRSLPLPASGRSAEPIIALANWLIDWSRTEHPQLLPEMETLTRPHIRPTEPDDPQPNPKAGNPAIFFLNRALTPEEEIRQLVDNLRKWLPGNPDKTVAILVPYHFRGDDFRAALEQSSIPYNDALLRSSSTTRSTIEVLKTLLRFVSQPQKSDNLQNVWSKVWLPGKRRLPTDRYAALAEYLAIHGVATESGRAKEKQFVEGSADGDELPEAFAKFGRALGQLRFTEQFLFPKADDDWLKKVGWIEEDAGFGAVVEDFRTDMGRWCAANTLPIGELLLTLAQDIFSEPSELGLAYGVAVHLATLARDRPHLRTLDFLGELDDIGRNRRRLLNFREDAQGFEPPAGEVTIATMHSAKGLEWDRVYLTSVSDYDFPSGGADDNYRGELWYARDNLNLWEEALAQVEQLHMGTLDEYLPGDATEKARKEVAAERLRLLFVGITRARQALILTYNTGRFHERRPNAAALAFTAMEQAWRERRASSA